MDARLKVSIIAAVSENGIIGKEGDLPWRLKDDLRRFASLTKGHIVIVGRKTHEAILQRLGHPLKDRGTIVLTRNPEYEVQGELQNTATSLDDALAISPPYHGEVFIIGGAELYKEALPLADRLYLTRVHTRCSGDASFPSMNMEEWDVELEERHPADQRNEYSYSFINYLRKMKPELVNTGSFVILENARHDDQRGVMRTIESQGLCPFCRENETAAELMPVLKEGRYWHIRENRWPYASTTLHHLLILNRHAEDLGDLTATEAAELLWLCQQIVEERGLTGGALGLRFGDPTKNGATVDHLHAHLIVADPDVSKSDYKDVRFRMGPKSQKAKVPSE